MATKIDEIFTVTSIWRYVVSVKSMVKISSIFVAFIENTNYISYIYFCQNMTIWLVREISNLFFHATMWELADHCLLFLSNEWSKGNRSQQRYRHRLLLLNLLWQKLRSLLLSFNGAANELELWSYILKSLLPSFFALFLKNYWIGGTFFLENIETKGYI